MTLEEQHRLITEAQAGDHKSRDILVTRFLPLVHKQLTKYPMHFKDDGLQVGALALMHAITKFEVDRGLAFPTYAMWWIRSNLKLAFYDNMNTICTSKNNRHVTIHSMWGKLKDSELSHQDKISWIAVRTGLSEDRVELVVAAASTASLQFNLSQDGDGDTLESITPSDDPSAEEKTFDNNAKTYLTQVAKSALTCLSDKERAVVEAYYLGGLSFIKIGKALGVSKQRADQIEKAARRKLLSALIPLEADIRTALQ